jgi:M6 family metalloprotease-like protein
LLALAAGAAQLGAQDVEMLGRRYGTQPPAGYFREMARDPEAYRFTRGRAERGRVLEAAGVSGPAGVGAIGAPQRALGPRGQPVIGTFRVPVVLGLFSDSPPTPPYARATLQSVYFDAPTGTVTEYYDEVSNGNLTLLGESRDWVQVAFSQAAVTQNESALVCCGIGTYIKQILALQTGVDWGVYDNDGPDGVPNSGDDDGFVDALAVMHPTRGAECGGTGSSGRIWSHKWTLDSASGSGAYTTTSPRFGGGVIRIDDYFVQGIVSCSQTSLNEIGVFVHETGHAFGLPDLYDTRSSGPRHNGAGTWDLMATGTWGCNNNTPQRPCHLGAWSKAMLGWVTVDTLPADADLGTLTLPPVETSGTVFRVDAGDGSGEYFLLENRQRIGYDDGLWAEGLLVWQVDADVVAARWPGNSVNASNHMGVWLRQADGLDQLGRTSGGNRGDAGDAFPGLSANTGFHAGSNPASVSFERTATGLTVLDVARVGGDVHFRLSTRFTRLTVNSSGTTPGASGIFTVDGAPVPAPPANVVLSAPYAPRVIEAVAGEVVAPGERRPFLQWSDAPSAPRARSVTTPLTDATYLAEYGGSQYQLLVELLGGVDGVAPGSFQATPASPDLWFAPSTSVSLTAVAQTGFSFLGWTGALAGQPNPAAVVMNAPVSGGASFQVIYAVADVELALTAAATQDVQLVVSNGTAPIDWSILAGALPAGLALSSTGRLTGASLDVGSYPLTLEATDALGLSGTATLTLEVAEPAITVADLASPLLLGPVTLDPLLQAFLDRQGNADGDFDLGDFRAWVLAHPSLPFSAAVAPVAAPSHVTIPVRLAPRSEGR